MYVFYLQVHTGIKYTPKAVVQAMKDGRNIFYIVHVKICCIYIYIGNKNGTLWFAMFKYLTVKIIFKNKYYM